MKLSTIAYLLHQANSECNSKEFYELKKEILEKYGTCDGYDIQFVEGKRCHSCDGTGIWDKREDYLAGGEYIIECNHCFDGWYKRPFWSILERRVLGKFTFHIPIKKSYKSGGMAANIIGYIKKEPSEFAEESFEILKILHSNGGLFNISDKQ